MRNTECLKNGEKWEDGFCDALCNSSVFVPVISKGTHAKIDKLRKHSECDNVLLEYDLALELVCF